MDDNFLGFVCIPMERTYFKILFRFPLTKKKVPKKRILKNFQIFVNLLLVGESAYRSSDKSEYTEPQYKYTCTFLGIGGHEWTVIHWGTG